MEVTSLSLCQGDKGSEREREREKKHNKTKKASDENWKSKTSEKNQCGYKSEFKFVIAVFFSSIILQFMKGGLKFVYVHVTDTQDKV